VHLFAMRIREQSTEHQIESDQQAARDLELRGPDGDRIIVPDSSELQRPPLHEVNWIVAEVGRIWPP
jgi:hypothetical protein